MKKNWKSFFSFLLSVVGAAVGAPSLMGAAVGEYGSDTDPNTDTPLEGGVKTNPTDKGGIAQHGQDASASALDEAGMLDRSRVIREKVYEYHAHKYPFYALMMERARQLQVKGKKEAEYPEVGELQFEAYTKTATQAGTDGDPVSLGLYKNDAAIFQPKTTVFVDMPGYDKDGNPDGSLLMLYVVGFDANNMPRVTAINGPVTSGKSNVPAIPAGTRLQAGSPALNEVEVRVSPDNLIPQMKTVYLQKKAYAVETTDFFKEVDKDADWGENDIKRMALDAYKQKYTATTLFGVPSKFATKDKNGHLRLCYTQEGVMSQLRMGYQLSGGLTYSDLIAICKMLFTKWTDSTSIDVFCGSDFIEQLLNIDFGTRTPIVYANDDVLKAKIATFECTFGTLRFVHEMGLTRYHLGSAAIALPTSDCIHLFRQNGATYKIDGKKGEGGDIEETEAWFFVQDDTFIVPTMCSMLIGPSEIFTRGYAPIEKKIVSVTAVPANPSTGDVIYLTKASGNLAVGAYEYDGTNWIHYEREVNA